jgi:hypothetical protein
MVVPRHVIGADKKGKKAPSDKVNIACVGVGGKGFSDTQSVSTENIVALCDVDDMMMANFLKSDEHPPERKAMYEKAKKYRDFRVMLDKEKTIDAITVSVPDHQAGQTRFCPKAVDSYSEGSEDASPSCRAGQSRDSDGKPGTLQGRCAADL